MKPKDVVKWKESDWKTKVKYAMPSGGGAVGVVFVWTDKVPIGKPKPSTSQFVIKPIRGTAASTKFAEYILGKVAGALSPHSKGIQHDTSNAKSRGKVVEDVLSSFKTKEKNPAIQQRWNEVWTHYQAADSYLIQETQVGIQEFGDEYRTLWGLTTLLLNQKLMENLGKLFIADAMIGNGDRLCKVNAGNIIFKGNGQVCSIDSATVLTNYKEVLADVTEISWVMNNQGFSQPQTPHTWTQGIVHPATGSEPLAIPSKSQQKEFQKTMMTPALPQAFNMEKIFDAPIWWEKEFKGYFEKSLKDKAMDEQLPEDDEWNYGKESFLRGVELGKRELDKRLSGINWLLVKMSFKKYVSKYGGDANLDWTNFKVRRLYYQLRRKGYSEQQAMNQVNVYVNRKLHMLP